MGNIFKTLGLDDLARSIPVVGGGVANFLNNLNTGQKSGPGQQNSNFLSGMVKTDSPRMSNEDYQFNQDLLDSSNPRETARQGAFLEGLAPSQGKAHNTYQDATYGQDTKRSTERIQSMSKDLNMSPWDLMGTSAATPVQAAPQSNQGGSNSQFLSQMAPVQIAKMNNETALKQTKMQTDAQLQIAGQNNQTSTNIANIQTAQGQVPLSQAALNAANKLLVIQNTETSKAAEAQGWAQAAATNSQQILNTIETFLKTLPKEIIDFGMIKEESYKGSKHLQQLFRMAGGQNMDQKSLQQAISSMPASSWASVNKELIETALLISKAARGGMSLANDTGRFLGNLGKNFMK